MTYEEALKELKHEIDMLPKEPPSDFVVNENVWFKEHEKIIDAHNKAIEALEKQIPENHFINECECIVDYDTLYKAIDKKCKSLNCYLQNQYRIVLRNSYPSVCINRKWFYVHILVCEYVNNKIRKGYVVHHKDKNKLNAMAENLEIMTNRKHLKRHGEEHKGIDFRSKEGKIKCINAAK